MCSRSLAWAALAAWTFPALGLAQAEKPPVRIETESDQFETADGVKLQGIFYKANPTKLKNNSCVLLLHPYKASVDAQKKLTDLALTLATEGFNVFQFSLRGHGKDPTDVVANEFWKFPHNRDNLTGANRNPPKQSIVLKDFRGDGKDYFPFLVNDVMAARVHLDRKNDNSLVNTSSVYLVGVGDAVNLGLFFATTEWYREAKKPNLPPAFEPKVIDPRRTLQDSEVAGKDIAGAVWISPTKPVSMSDAAVKAFASKYAVRLRDETPMLFINDDRDARGKAASKFFYNDVLVAAPKPGAKLARLEQTFHKELKPTGKTALVGVDLIGKGTGLEEDVVKFLEKVQEERKNKPQIPQRGYTKPLLVNPQAFGVGS